MEEVKTKKKWKRKRRNAMQPDEDILELEEKEEKAALAEASKETGRTCAPADYKMMEELVEDPVSEERERRRKAVEKWTKESNDEFARGLATHGKRFRKLADPLPDLTVADCVEHYYMAKPFYFNFEEWRAQEKVNAERSMALSAEEREGTSSQGASSYAPDGAQTSSSASESQSSSAIWEELEEAEKEKLEETLEAPAANPVVIEIIDEPEVILVE